MGQQQLLLIVLGVIIVGIAIVVGISMFKSSAVDANRSAIASDLANLASKAQRYYRTPVELGGGGQKFDNFALSTLDRSNPNGTYGWGTTDGGAGFTGLTGTAGTDYIFIYAVGTEKASVGGQTQFVAAVALVTPDKVEIKQGWIPEATGNTFKADVTSNTNTNGQTTSFSGFTAQ
ncbi:hypothetical protein [Candidatus Kryptobacter tengchongensis]|uniref:Uncharacterized protein n=1 Tax=Kryptobacter tengchongensis TaxID=1643429 RepID=A0A656D8S4_KRYT1|nr:hypothetical protein [Candidatus Kryptobacter tengchongensis]CUT01680.1 hypothetical protein JGI24_00983 [Candidatus Kryptobacter tengchongensis]